MKTNIKSILHRFIAILSLLIISINLCACGKKSSIFEETQKSTTYQLNDKIEGSNERAAEYALGVKYSITNVSEYHGTTILGVYIPDFMVNKHIAYDGTELYSNYGFEYDITLTVYPKVPNCQFNNAKVYVKCSGYYSDEEIQYIKVPEDDSYFFMWIDDAGNKLDQGIFKLIPLDVDGNGSVSFHIKHYYSGSSTPEPSVSIMKFGNEGEVIIKD